MKRITLDELLKSHAEESYEQQYCYIINLLKQEKIKPVKASGKNGKKPALYNSYWIVEQEKDYSGLEDELKYRPQWEIHPFVPAYQLMLSKAGQVAKLPDTKEKQNRNIANYFFSYFSNTQTDQIKEILNREEYIPQEILNISDF